jgi:LysM repeat protein
MRQHIIDNAEDIAKSTSDKDPVNPIDVPSPVEEKPKEEDKIVQSKPEEEIQEPIAPSSTELISTPEQSAVNIADTKAVEEEKVEVKKEEEEPKDEFARLKAKLDKAVYASEKAAASKKTEKKDEVKAESVIEKKEVAAEKKVEAKQQASDNKPGYYTVKKGENAFAIAKKHHITMTQLKQWNKLDFGEIKAGQKLRVK